MSGSASSLLTFNGEIYNYRSVREELAGAGLRFTSASDTEVVLAGIDTWAESSFSRFEGMFALAHYQPDRGCLLLARDPVGQKPLYYLVMDGGDIAFASELRVLLPLVSNRRLSTSGLADYLRFGYSLSSHSMIEGIHKVDPGTSLAWQDSKFSVRRYWAAPPMDVIEPPNDEVLLDQLEARLSSAVERTLVSDVPVGVLLSGGVDSSVIAALSARRDPGIRTYSVEFPGHAVDEGDAAAAVAARLGTTHTRLQARSIDVELLTRVLEGQDEPIADPSVIPTSILFEAISHECRVVLGGDGGDELFGGYDHYRYLMRLQGPAWRATSRLRQAIGGALADATPPGMRGRFWLELMARPSSLVNPPLNRLFLESEAQALLVEGAAILSHPVPRKCLSRGEVYLDELQRADLAYYLPNDILHKVDRCSMSYSVEARSPFLDRQVIDIALGSLPISLRMNGGLSKILLRRLRLRLIGDGLELGRKQGFSPPLHAIMQDPRIQTKVIEVLKSAPADTWNARTIDGWLRALQAGSRVSWQVFALASLISWQGKWQVASPSVASRT